MCSVSSFLTGLSDLWMIEQEFDVEQAYSGADNFVMIKCPNSSDFTLDPAEHYLRSLDIPLWSDSEEPWQDISSLWDFSEVQHVCDDAYVSRMTTVMCGPDNQSAHSVPVLMPLEPAEMNYTYLPIKIEKLCSLQCVGWFH